MLLKQLLRRIIYREKSSSKTYIKWLRKQGITIGEGCTVYDPRSTHIDVQNPGMLEIGNYVRITAGTTVLTHDYSLSVLASVEGDIVGSVEKTTLGSNIFIGRNAIILKGVTIGDNVIIGAGAVVTKNCDSNSVYAGVPAHKICSIESLYRKRKEGELEAAKKVSIAYYEKFHKKPDEKVLREYQMLFRDRNSIPESLEILMKDSSVEELCKTYYKESTPQFSNIDSFLKWCGIGNEEN